jgi:hypothetical protein
MLQNETQFLQTDQKPETKQWYDLSGSKDGRDPSQGTSAINRREK